MPHIAIEVAATKNVVERAAVTRAAVDACVEAIGAPPAAIIATLSTYDPDSSLLPPGHSFDFTNVVVRLYEGRTAEAKRAFVEQLRTRLAEELGYASWDVWVCFQDESRDDLLVEHASS